ncbi:hypothetical protein DFO67_102100 [Modicisalibacter xianhensis]|uniref:Uncharacterized protein n=1 Tax=Modicisalibacter xianhensis TaxID=442341 RepID=A0A4R8FYI7_9GAMM|nr:hypothetical protein DFO67_102100 [Halomonas xianhensis]
MSEATEKQAMKTGEKVGVTFFHSTKSASCKGGFWQFSSEQARQPYVVRIRHLQPLHSGNPSRQRNRDLR